MEAIRQDDLGAAYLTLRRSVAALPGSTFATLFVFARPISELLRPRALEAAAGLEHLIGA